MSWTRWRRAAALVAAAAMAATTVACTSEGQAEPAATGSGGGGEPLTLTIGARVDNNSFDTADLEIGNRIQYWQPVYDTLVRLDADSKPQPNLATEWEYSEDGTVLTLQLRDDVTFTDGAPFDAEAVKANIEHIKAGSGQNQFMVAGIDEVVVVSPTEVELRLSEPVPSLVTYLGWVGGAMASPKALSSGDLATNPVGSGPYVYDAANSQAGTEYRYERNEDYWNAEAFPYDTYVVRPLNDVTPTLNALKTGQIDAALLTPAVADEAKASGITVETRAVAWAGLLIGDREGKKVKELADPRVRQAINLALDRGPMVEFILNGYGEPTTQVFNTSSEAYVESLDAAYPYDPAKAKQLMDQANVDGFTITMPQWDSPWNDLFPVLADQLAEIGVTVEYKQVPPDQAISSVLSGDYPVAFFPLASASAWQDLQTWVTPKAPWNMQGASDPELSKLITAAQNAPQGEQEAAFQAVNQWLVDEAWFAPLFRPDQVFGVGKGTQVQMQAQNAVPSLWLYGPAE
ncbi:ABC transporter substrate-binding protein [uncultured Phycicoccus sp.]|uniref:ABC transporter substrate-binding protein n=1 Tax=uncultured Phycicoccus sp. TaxID=661422 RepID=UPI0026131F65|nr:ABC transporter substrate-binding protein [uncultured Phycicoccus sp.]